MVKPLEQEDNKGELVTDPDHSKSMMTNRQQEDEEWERLFITRF